MSYLAAHAASASPDLSFIGVWWFMASLFTGCGTMMALVFIVIIALED